MTISNMQKEEILVFISNMKKTGENVLRALIHYKDYMTKNRKVKIVIGEIVDEINKGKDIEEALYKNNLITSFQYAILKNSNNKNEAYDKILKYGKNQNKADKFYIKQWSKALLTLIFLCFAMPYLNGVVGNMVKNVKGYKPSFQENGFVTFILNNTDNFYYFGWFFTFLFLGGLFFYFYTYRYNLPLHYKLFPIKAFNDSETYFEVINDMLKSGLKTYTIFELLSKFMYPPSSRKYFKKIYEKLKTNDDYPEVFYNLGINNFAVFVLKTAKEINNVKEGFSNALISIKDYKNKKESFHYELIDLLVFIIMVVPYSIILWYLTVVTIDVSSI